MPLIICKRNIVEKLRWKAGLPLIKIQMLEIIAGSIRVFFAGRGCTGVSAQNEEGAMHAKSKSTIAVLVMITVGAGSAVGQDWNALCPNGHWVPSGPGVMCVPNQAPRNTPAPRFEPQYQPPRQQDNIYNNPVTREWESLGNQTMSRQPLRQNIPLSSGVVQQEIYVPPPPSNYVDPFGSSGPSYGSSTYRPSEPARAPGNIWDPNQAVRMQPPQPQAPTSTPPSAFQTYTNPRGCTFDSPDCR